MGEIWVDQPSSAPFFAPTGLPGATAPTRYVGGTVSGPPTIGTFAVGDFVIDQTGVVWVCSVAGTPGTWVDASSSGHVIGYQEITTASIPVTNVVADIAGISVPVTTVGRSIFIEVVLASVTMTNIDNVLELSIWEGAAKLKSIFGPGAYKASANVGSLRAPAFVLTPSVGSHTYKARAQASTGTSPAASIFSGTTFPSFIKVTNL